MKKLLLAFLASVFALFLIGCNPEALEEESAAEGPETVKIGFSGPMIGDISWLGETSLNGIKLALKEESNENWTFEVIAEDDQCDPKQAVNAYNKLKGSGIAALVGPECSAAFLAVVPLTERDQMIAITPSATNADIANSGDFAFRTVASDAFQGKVVADSMYNDFGFKKVAINAKNDAWGQGLVEVFTSRFTELGGEVTTTESHEANATDMKTQLTRIKNSGAEALYAPTFTPEMIVMLKQMTELGMNDWIIFGGDASADEIVAESVGAISGNVILAKGVDNQDGIAKQFEAKYMETYGKEHQTYSKEAYDAAKLLAQAIKAVGSNSSEIRDYLYAVEGYNGASGTVSFDERGEMTEKGVGLYTFKDGKLVEYVK